MAEVVVIDASTVTLTTQTSSVSVRERSKNRAKQQQLAITKVAGSPRFQLVEAPSRPPSQGGDTGWNPVGAAGVEAMSGTRCEHIERGTNVIATAGSPCPPRAEVATGAG